MILSHTTFIKPTDDRYKECKFLCTASRNLYNSCLYGIRQHYFSTGGDLFTVIDEKKQYLFNYTYLYHLHKDTPEYRTDKHKDYKGRLVNTKIMTQVFLQVNQEFSNHLKSLKKFNKCQEGYTGKPKIPDYKRTGQLFMARIPKEAISFVKKGYVKIASADIYIPIPGTITKSMVREIIISPVQFGFNICISYETGSNKVIPKQEEVQRICGLDFGLNNLCSLASNDSSIPTMIINGRPVKYINQYYNKELASLQSTLSKRGLYTSNATRRLTSKRNHKIKDYMHKASTAIVNYLLEHNIECLIVGSNKNWKQNIQMGKKSNQNFVSVPFYVLKEMLKYKCERAGIFYKEREESYTSKCSFLDMEPICKHESYKGRRKHRGLFVSSNGIKINADINGALNIARKEFGDTIFTYPDLYNKSIIVKVTRY